MAVEMEKQEGMKMETATQTQHLDYLGALFPEDRKLVLVPVDPSHPWGAFRTMRSLMRRKKTPAQVDLFRSEFPADAPAAKVIPLISARRAAATN